MRAGVGAAGTNGEANLVCAPRRSRTCRLPPGANRQLLDGELTSLSRLKDQDLHLIAAALDEISLNDSLAAYVSANDAELERDDFLRKVVDRILDDLADRRRQ